MVLPHQLGFSTTSEGNTAKPDASCTQQELDDEQRDGDQAKGLKKMKLIPSASHTGWTREDARTECQVVK
jgi:hypothetical protein